MQAYNGEVRPVYTPTSSTDAEVNKAMSATMDDRYLDTRCHNLPKRLTIDNQM